MRINKAPFIGMIIGFLIGLGIAYWFWNAFDTATHPVLPIDFPNMRGKSGIRNQGGAFLLAPFMCAGIGIIIVKYIKKLKK